MVTPEKVANSHLLKGACAVNTPSQSLIAFPAPRTRKRDSVRVCSFFSPTGIITQKIEFESFLFKELNFSSPVSYGFTV